MGGCTPKQAAAKGAIEVLQGIIGDGVIGIGTGSTVAEFIRLASGFLSGRRVVASSIDTELRLRSIGVEVVSPLQGPSISVYIDGADEVDIMGRMIKGGGGALLGEKVLAYNSRVNVFIVDESKLVDMLGERRPVPVEVVPWALGYVLDRIRGMGYRVEARTSRGKAGPVVSDWGGVIVDVYTGPMEDPGLVDSRLRGIPGVVETGIFTGLADYIVVGRSGCRWEVIKTGRV